MGTVVGVGNCQVQGMVRCAGAVLGLDPVYLHPIKLAQNPRILAKTMSKADLVLAQRGTWAEQVSQTVKSLGRPGLPIIIVPKLYFFGLHPDLAMPVKAAGKCPELPLGTANSAILLTAWDQGIGPDEALKLFRDDVYEALGYYDAFTLATERLVRECELCGFDVSTLIPTWVSSGAFFHVPLHPRINVLHDVVVTLLRESGHFTGEASSFSLEDPLSNNTIWPIYPEIAQKLGLEGNYIFKPKNLEGETSGPLAPMYLEEFVSRTYEGYQKASPKLASFPRMCDPRLKAVRSLIQRESHAFINTWGDLEFEAAEAMEIVCDEELLDPVEVSEKD